MKYFIGFLLLEVVYASQAAPNVSIQLGEKMNSPTIEEGDDVYLQCVVRANPPVPEVTWFFEDVPLHQNYSAGIIISNQALGLQNVRRGQRGNYKCLATNAEGEGQSQELFLDVKYAPACRESQNNQYVMFKGEEINITCKVEANPREVTFHWALNNSIEYRKLYKFTSKGTHSVLTFSPRTLLEFGAVLCWGTNTIGVQKQPCVTFITPSAAPEVSLHLNNSTITEGEDVYFECMVRPNPPVTEVKWFFEGVPLRHNFSFGIFIYGQVLVLKNVRKEHSGNYKCLAANTEGEGQSQELLLTVRFVPTCKASKADQYVVGLGEAVNITCEVEADPKEVSFRWALNNSVENVELHNFISKGTRSVLTFTPRTMLQFGTVLCWGQNAVGLQKDPCVTHIISAEAEDCLENERFNPCGTDCPLTCENYDNPPEFCNTKCKTGCECENGFVRLADRKCVRPDECPNRQGRYCDMPADSGLCRGYMLRFFYDPRIGQCLKFIYSGCAGNRNNFKTEEECYKKCGDGL